MSAVFVEPGPESDPISLLLRYLDFYRDTVVDKLAGLSEEQLRSSPLPSGWTPLELLAHLAAMERRWMLWGFGGEAVADPWPDQTGGRWQVATGTSLQQLIEQLREGGRHTRRVVAGAGPGEPAAVGGRFDGTEPVPSLLGLLCHVLQEYARHVGQLDVARELIDGSTGE